MKVYERISKSSNLSIKQFSKDIASYLELEWDEAYYQRMRDIIKGERGTATPLEHKAIAYWEYTLDNPFEASKCGFWMQGAERKLDQLQKFILTGNANKVQARKIVKDLKGKIPKFNE